MPAYRQVDRPISLDVFLSQRSVFTVDELERFLSKHRSGNMNTRKALLTYHRSKGRVIPIRRGLYATVSLGSDPNTHPVDPYLIAAKLTEDAVLAYHTALEFHGKSYSVYSELVYMSESKSLSLQFRSNEFKRVPVPYALSAKQQEMYGVVTHKRSGVDVRATNLERTFVDALDRPDLTGSWEEIWRSLETIEFFDLDKVTEYVNLLGNATTAAKVGFFLEQHKEPLMVDDIHLKPLWEMKPKQPHYLIRGDRKDCRLISNWNLLVPEEIHNRSWAEVL